jgi:hypothetical protein
METLVEERDIVKQETANKVRRIVKEYGLNTLNGLKEIAEGNAVRLPDDISGHITRDFMKEYGILAQKKNKGNEYWIPNEVVAGVILSAKVTIGF